MILNSLQVFLVDQVLKIDLRILNTGLIESNFAIVYGLSALPVVIPSPGKHFTFAVYNHSMRDSGLDVHDGVVVLGVFYHGFEPLCRPRDVVDFT